MRHRIDRDKTTPYARDIPVRARATSTVPVGVQKFDSRSQDGNVHAARRPFGVSRPPPRYCRRSVEITGMSNTRPPAFPPSELDRTSRRSALSLPHVSEIALDRAPILVHRSALTTEPAASASLDENSRSTEALANALLPACRRMSPLLCMTILAGCVVPLTWPASSLVLLPGGRLLAGQVSAVWCSVT